MNGAHEQRYKHLHCVAATRADISGSQFLVILHQSSLTFNSEHRAVSLLYFNMCVLAYVHGLCFHKILIYMISMYAKAVAIVNRGTNNLYLKPTFILDIQLYHLKNKDKEQFFIIVSVYTAYQMNKYTVLYCNEQ